MDCEVLVDSSIVSRGQKILYAMVAASASAGINCKISDHYTGSSDWLMTWGMGSTQRRPWLNQHKSRGGRIIGWDLGYWDRDNYMRLTIDEDHPQQFLKAMDGSRFNASGISLHNLATSSGPIILVGLGRKQRIALGDTTMKWESNKWKAIHAAYPNKTVLYRPKRSEVLYPLRSALGPIEKVLHAASLVVCRHSNVAIDACIAGIPVVCEDGIAAALYGNDLLHPVKPSIESREFFLKQVAWWQWKPSEAQEAWKFIISILT